MASNEDVCCLLPYHAQAEFPLCHAPQVNSLPAIRAAGDKAGSPATKWITQKQLQGEGLSSSVCKVAKFAAKSNASGKQGIKRFFAAVVKD